MSRCRKYGCLGIFLTLFLAIIIGCGNNRHDLSSSSNKHNSESVALEKQGDTLCAGTNYSSALSSYLQSLTIAKQYNIHNRIPQIYHKIGVLFSRVNDIETAIPYYRKALALVDAEKDPEQYFKTLNNLVYAYSIKGNADSARYFNSLIASTVNHKESYNFDHMFNTGLIFQMENQLDSALQCFHLAAEAAETPPIDELSQASAYSSIAEIYKNLNLYDSASRYLRINEKIARNGNHTDLLVISLRDLADNYAAMGHQDEAIEAKQEYLALADSIFNRDEFTKMKNEQGLYELESKSSTIRSLSTVNESQKHWILMLGIILVILIAFSITLWWQKRKPSNTYAELYDHNRKQLESENYFKHKIGVLEQELAEIKSKTSTPRDETPQLERRLMQTQEQRNKILAAINRIFEETEDYCTMDYTIDSLASSIDSNVRYVSEVINNEFGKNFRALLNEYRIKKSMMMLEDKKNYGHLTIKAISEMVGYKSQSTFISLFTKQTGLKPSLYQSLSRDKDQGIH